MGLSKVLWYYLWIAPHVLQAVLLIAMLRLRICRRLPIFTAYTAFELLQFGVIFPLAFVSQRIISPTIYGGLAMAGLAGSTVLRFAVIYEILGYLFRNYKSLRHFGKPAFQWSTLALGVIAVWLAMRTHSHGGDAATFLLFLGRRTVIFTQFGLLLAIFAFSRTLRLVWRRDIYGIALGFGIFASVEMVSSALIAQFGYSLHTYMDYLTMGTYHVCVLIWMAYILWPEGKGVGLTHVPDHSDLEVWNAEMERLLKR